MGLKSMSPLPSSFSAPVASKMMRLSIDELTANAQREGMFALIRPVIISALGRWVATIK